MLFHPALGDQGRNESFNRAVVLPLKTSSIPMSFPGRDELRDTQQVVGMCGSSCFPKYPQTETFTLKLPWHLTCQDASIQGDYSGSSQEVGNKSVLLQRGS